MGKASAINVPAASKSGGLLLCCITGDVGSQKASKQDEQKGIQQVLHRFAGVLVSVTSKYGSAAS